MAKLDEAQTEAQTIQHPHGKNVEFPYISFTCHKRPSGQFMQTGSFCELMILCGTGYDRALLSGRTVFPVGST